LILGRLIDLEDGTVTLLMKSRREVCREHDLLAVELSKAHRIDDGSMQVDEPFLIRRIDAPAVKGQLWDKLPVSEDTVLKLLDRAVELQRESHIDMEAEKSIVAPAEMPKAEEPIVAAAETPEAAEPIVAAAETVKDEEPVTATAETPKVEEPDTAASETPKAEESVAAVDETPKAEEPLALPAETTKAEEPLAPVSEAVQVEQTVVSRERNACCF